MESFKKGDRVRHPVFGLGTVCEDSTDHRAEVLFDQGGQKLLALKQADLRLAKKEDELEEQRKKTDWLDLRRATFEIEPPGAQHFPGSHWSPFYDDPSDLFRQLPEIIPQSVIMESFTDLQTRKPAYEIPADWPKAVCLAWPQRERGLLEVLKMGRERNELVSVYPFAGLGTEHTITLERVKIWESGVEAQIEAKLGEAAICFFDTLYAGNRAWYLAGDTYQFILTGIAYGCRVAKDEVFMVKQPPEVVAFLREKAAAEGWDEPEEIEEFHTAGMTALLPVPEWDNDDYRFRGTVRSVKPVEMLGQSSWSIRTTVLRGLGDNADVDLDILVTRKIWGSRTPPSIGQEIEGALWLQGQLWYPHRWHQPSE